MKVIKWMMICCFIICSFFGLLLAWWLMYNGGYEYFAAYIEENGVWGFLKYFFEHFI